MSGPIGYAAEWSREIHGHRAPRSHSGYAYFNGVITISEVMPENAPLHMTAADALSFYGSKPFKAFVNVIAKDDVFGIRLDGDICPDLDPRIGALGLAAYTLACDWRLITGHLELIAVTLVKRPETRRQHRSFVRWLRKAER